MLCRLLRQGSGQREDREGDQHRRVPLHGDLQPQYRGGGVPLSPDRKYALHKISRKIARHPGEVDITTEEGSLLKEVAAEAYSCGAYGQVVDIIENNV